MQTTRYNQFLFYGLLFVFIWLPLPFGSKPEWAMGLLQLLVFTLAACWLLGFACGVASITVPFRKGIIVSIPLVLIACWQQYQAVRISPDPFATYIHSMLALSYSLLFMLVLLLITNKQRVTLLAWTLILSGGFQALYGTLSTLSGLEWGFFLEKDVGRGVATGTFVNRNNYAGFLGMTSAIGTGLLLSQLQEGKTGRGMEWLRHALNTLLSNKVLLRSILAAMVIGIVMSRSRMGNTAFFSSLLISGLLYGVIRKAMSRGMIILLVSLIAIDTMIVSQWFGLEKVVERIEQTRLEKEGRTDVNPVSMTIIADQPVTGSGAGAFYTVLPAFHDGSWRGFYDLAHNDFLQFPLEFGLPAFILLVIMVLTAFWQAIQAMRTRRNRLMIGMGFSSVMGMLAIMIHSATDFNLQIPANAAYFICLMALAFIARHLPGDTQKRKKVHC